MYRREESAGYQVFLLRLWREQEAMEGQENVWRCSLEDPRTHQKRGFESVETLSVYLGGLAGGTAPSERKSAESEVYWRELP